MIRTALVLLFLSCSVSFAEDTVASPPQSLTQGGILVPDMPPQAGNIYYQLLADSIKPGMTMEDVRRTLYPTPYVYQRYVNYREFLFYPKLGDERETWIGKSFTLTYRLDSAYEVQVICHRERDKSGGTMLIVDAPLTIIASKSPSPALIEGAIKPSKSGLYPW